MSTEKKSGTPYTINVVQKSPYGFDLTDDNRAIVPVDDDVFLLLQKCASGGIAPAQITDAFFALSDLGIDGVQQAFADLFYLLAILQASPDHDCVTQDMLVRFLHLKDAADCFVAEG